MERVLFTKEMKKDYTILAPQMLFIHFSFIESIFKKYGYKVEVLKTEDRQIIETGLKYVHNDTCYPALVVIGQLIHALQSGNYDLNKVALFITQTGGGCRASNYIHLLRKALKNANLEQIPVVSLSLSGMESNPGFKLSLPMLQEFVYLCVYGDYLMWVYNQRVAHEKVKGSSRKLLDEWIETLKQDMTRNRFGKKSNAKKRLIEIREDFEKIEVESTKKPVVGIVGEIYVKFAPLGNNNLEEFLMSEEAEVVVPGLFDFILFKVDNRIEDTYIYGGKLMKRFLVKLFSKYLTSLQNLMIKSLTPSKSLRVMTSFAHLKTLVPNYVGYGNKMGEGWLLTAEMLELIESGINNIVCTQPFGCLPNHISGKGMMRLIRQNHPTSNIVAIDYDPGASKVNQENRIKLMLENARKNLK